jgi:hypothetical protein
MPKSSTPTPAAEPAGEQNLPPATEYMRGTPNSGTVTAEETLCDRTRDLDITLKPGESFYDWVIFHNVPCKGGTVYLQWDPYGSDEIWVDLGLLSIHLMRFHHPPSAQAN